MEAYSLAAKTGLPQRVLILHGHIIIYVLFYHRRWRCEKVIDFVLVHFEYSGQVCFKFELKGPI